MTRNRSGSAKPTGRGSRKPRPPTRSRLVVCVRDGGYLASLEPRKIYRVLPDRAAAAHNLLRIIDESGEDYLYPADCFAPVRVADDVRRALRIG